MTFNVIASAQTSGLNGGSPNSRTHNLTGSFLAGDIVLVLTMANNTILGTANAASYNYGLPAGFTPVTSLTGVTNSIHYGYKVLTANQTNYSTGAFTTNYETFCMIVRGYEVKEAFVGTLPASRTFAVGDVVLLPGGAGQSGFVQQGIGYDSSAIYSSASRELTTTSTTSIPNVSQYSIADGSKTFVLLGYPPVVPTGVTVTNTPVPNGTIPTVSWTAAGQTSYRMRWRKVS